MSLAELSRSKLIEYESGLATYERRLRRAEQSRRGYRDRNGEWQCGLMAFIKYFWDVLEPETPLVRGWPMEAICEHLEAVSYGDITHLLINVFPGAAKSIITDVFFPAWEWGPRNMAHLRYVAFSYSSSLTERDNDRFGTLITSEKYLNLWGERVKLTARGKIKTSNEAQGWKLASSVGGVGTGERGDRILLDDPSNVKDTESEVVRKETVRWFRESMSNRLNDMETGAIIIIMQRVHEDDVSGIIMSLGLDYCILKIPMEYDANYMFNDDGTLRRNEIGWIDPRYNEADPDGADGALAWPERFSPAACVALKAALGNYAWASQYQQTPAPRGGGIFQRDWWQLFESKDGKFPVFSFLLASLDTAFTEKEQNDPSALTLWGVYQNDDDQRRIMLVHAWRKHLQFSGPRIEMKATETREAYRQRTQSGWGLVEWAADTCSRFQVDKLLIEAKASGLSAAQELRNRYGLQNWGIQLCAVKGDKVARALAVQATFAQKIIAAPSRDWAEMVIDEMAVFPYGRFKDLTDSATQAIKYLRDTGMAQTVEEEKAAETDALMHRPKMRPVYPV